MSKYTSVIRNTKKMRKKCGAFIILAVLLFSAYANPKKADAIYPVSNIPGIPMDIFNVIENTANTLLTGYDWYDTLSDSFLLPALKAVLIEVVNRGITEEYSSGNNGKPYFVTDWQDYLYGQPDKIADDYILKNFLSNQLSGGKCKDANYQGSPYYKYLCDQGEAAIRKTGPRTTLPEYTQNPQENLFAEGNLRALSAYFECGNNPYCTTTETRQAYGQVVQQEREKALSKTDGGTLPQENADGSISAPASVYKSAISDALLLGNQTIVNAQNPEELMISIISRMAIEGLQKGFNSKDLSAGSSGASSLKAQQCNDRCWVQADQAACTSFCMSQ